MVQKTRSLVLVVLAVFTVVFIIAAHPDTYYTAIRDHDAPILRARAANAIPSTILVTLARHDSLNHSLNTLCQLRARFPEFHLTILAPPPLAYRNLPKTCGSRVSSIASDPSIPADFARALSGLLHLTAPDIHIHCYTSLSTRIPVEHASATLIQIPCTELQHASWLTTLSPIEWQNWHAPRIQLSVITNDRPQSLARLLRSISEALYFGDRISLHINMEQTSDSTTRSLVQNFTWPNGELFVRHRVIRGGLLPAVVESWYPQDNHTYGVLLEDDVEVSPMFYAWLKMSFLRYRYGSQSHRSSSLFGISLYQQKNSELYPSGRRDFHAPTVLSAAGFPEPYVPYLSQVPCSWGAAFFPEHWREFHDYIVLRLSEVSHDLSENIVPDVRSNKWRRSWKKYFIELVHLRGYTMLYPNFPNHISLSTNHLEVGSHVKKISDEKYEHKKTQYAVPLMQLPSSQTLLQGLLNGSLPRWSDLPVLDLLGSVTTDAELRTIAMNRRLQVSGCTWDTSAENTFDARELLCVGRETEEIP